jgi:Kyakuja-Dileera-Zisupton transposase
MQPILGPSCELTDTREIGTGYYLTNAQVDEWSKETLAALCPAYNEDESDNNSCAERWRSMRTVFTAKMWGVFQETGMFLALFRHGFVLLLADMVCSGEL